jgi:recombination protein RecR
MYSSSIHRVIQELKKLPSVGQHTAERFVIYWLKSGKKDVTELMLSLKDLLEKVKSCEICSNFDDTSPCSICSDLKRDHYTICVVENISDLASIEKTKEYNGTYQVLRGLITSTDDDGLQKTKVNELFDRVLSALKTDKPLKEIILALNPNVAGETTMLYIKNELKKIHPLLVVTRLARGLPMGSDIVYADNITLGSALKARN